MAVAPRSQAGFGLTTLVAWLVVAVPPAHAAPITMPLSGFNVELPAAWSLTAIQDMGVGGVQTLRHDGADLVGLIAAPLMDCAAALLPQAGERRHEAAWIPAGWGAKIDADARITVCSSRAGFPIVLMSQFRTAKEPYVALLAALDRAWQSSKAAQILEVVILPRSRLTVAVPPGLRLTSSDVTGSTSVAGIDVLQLAGKRGKAPFLVLSSNLGCDQAVAKVAEAMAVAESGDAQDWDVEKMIPSAVAAPEGWRPWSFGPRRLAYCATGTSPAAIVISPGAAAIQATGADDPTALLLASLGVELRAVPPPSGVVALAVTKRRVQLPRSWKVATSPVADGLLDGDGNAVAVTTAASTCDALIAGDTKDSMRFDPAWMPPGWRAVFSISTMTIAGCTMVDGGALNVAFRVTSLPRRLELIAVLESLRRDNLAPPPGTAAISTSSPPSTPSPTPVAAAPALPPASVTDATPRRAPAPLLPFPIRLAYQTVGVTDDRGHGVRLGLDRRYGDEALSASLHGELGYDSLTKLGHDVQVRVAYGLLESISVLAAAGHDGWGTGEDAPVVPHGLYGGLGVGLVSVIGRSLVRLEGLYLWRSSEPVAGVTEPDDETRLRLSVFRRLGPIQGLTGELRSTGDASTLLIGAHVRL